MFFFFSLSDMMKCKSLKIDHKQNRSGQVKKLDLQTSMLWKLLVQDKLNLNKIFPTCLISVFCSVHMFSLKNLLSYLILLYIFTGPHSKVEQIKQIRVASGIYPTASMMNHSCKPDIINRYSLILYSVFIFCCEEHYTDFLQLQ